MEKTVKQLLLLAAFASAMTACKKEDDDVVPLPSAPPNEEELITTLILTFTDTENAANVYELRYTDLDGDGGNDAVVTSDQLPNNRAFTLAVRVLDESGATAEEITEEILAEDEEHQFFFEVEGAAVTITYADTDADGNPIGLSNTALAGAASEGSLKVTLRHEPNKSAEGVAAGDITNAGGETDIEVTFPLVIE